MKHSNVSWRITRAVLALLAALLVLPALAQTYNSDGPAPAANAFPPKAPLGGCYFMPNGIATLTTAGNYGLTCDSSAALRVSIINGAGGGGGGGGSVTQGTTPWVVQQQDGSTLTLTGSGSGPLLGTGADATTGAIVMDGYSSFDMQVTAISGSNISVQKSNDNVTFYNENLCRPSTNAGNSTPSSVFASVTSVNCPASGKYTRLNSSGGTATVVLTRKVANPQPVAVFANLANASFTNSGLITTLNTAGTAGGVTSFSRIVSSAATTNATSAKASAGRLYKVYACNTTTTAKFIRFYNLAVAPTVGTSTVLFSRMLPPATASTNPLCQSFDQADIGWSFSAGIAYAITGGNADNDTTALVAGDVIQVSVEYQ